MAPIYKQDSSKLLQSAWGFRGEWVQVVGFVACCNYFSKIKKKLVALLAPLKSFHH